MTTTNTDAPPPVDLEGVKKDIEECCQLEAWGGLRRIAIQLAAEVEGLRTALEFYASEGSRENDHVEMGSTSVPVPYTAPIFSDCGQIARAALPGEGEGEG